MKNSGGCPKCACRKLYVVDEVSQPHSESSNSILPQYLVAAPMGRDLTGVADGTRYRSHACKLEAWVCSACGFVEWYGKDPSELESLARHGDGVRVVQARSEGAYR